MTAELWTITVQYDGEQPMTHVFDNPRGVQEMLDAILYNGATMLFRSLRVERTARGEVDFRRPAPTCPA